MDKSEIYAHIDHTLLKPVATWPQIEALCHEAIKHRMAAVCIPPSFVKRVRERFGKSLEICTVIGFPLGYNTTASKVFETKDTVADGADEVDMVVNLGDLKAGDFDKVTAEIAAVKEAAGSAALKVIIETCYLTDAEKIRLCRCVSEAGADFIKTSAGFGSAGAQLEDIALFKKHLAPGVKIKAAGGIRTRESMEQFLLAGSDRLGTSSAVSALDD